MIYATHKLYDNKQRVTTFQVVETKNFHVSKIYNFECEKHSMLWYDAIILSSKNHKDYFFDTLTEILEQLACNDDETQYYAYGVTYDTDGCRLSRLK